MSAHMVRAGASNKSGALGYEMREKSGFRRLLSLSSLGFIAGNNCLYNVTHGETVLCVPSSAPHTVLPSAASFLNTHKVNMPGHEVLGTSSCSASSLALLPLSDSDRNAATVHDIHATQSVARRVSCVSGTCARDADGMNSSNAYAPVQRLMVSIEDLTFLGLAGVSFLGPYPIEEPPKGMQHKRELHRPMPWSSKVALVLAPIQVILIDDVRADSMPLLRLSIAKCMVSICSGPERNIAETASPHRRRVLVLRRNLKLTSAGAATLQTSTTERVGLGTQR